MNILPHKYSDFQSKEYWNKFFSELKNSQSQFFQWYGSYEDYRSIFHDSNKSNNLIKNNERIFHVGCGKSTFGEDLYKAYKSNQHKLSIVNCDYSDEIINEMRIRLKNMNSQHILQDDKTNISYQVCDLLNNFTKNQAYKPYIHAYDTIIDKGTLDAMLPESLPQNIDKIKNLYFPNMELCLKKQHGKFIIISMLQQFILRTILEYFYDKHQKHETRAMLNYQIEIYECNIKESKLQPFLILLQELPVKQKPCILFHKLGQKKPLKLKEVNEVLEEVRQAQLRTEHNNKRKQLISGQRTKYNIFNKSNKNSLRYLIEIFDSNNKQTLKKNNCAVFIVPQGKQNSQIFSEYQGIESLSKQIACSRLLLIKLMPGNNFKSIQEIKNQLNEVIPDLIQQKCEAKQVPYLTDADELGTNYALFQNEQLIIDQVLLDGSPYRRLFLKSNLTENQCIFKLCHNGSNSHYSEFSKKVQSKILPPKKNMVIGIDKNQLFDENAQKIYSGLMGFLGYQRAVKGLKIMIYGEQVALAKYLYDAFENIQISLITKCKHLKEIVSTYFQIPPSQRFQIITANCIYDYIQGHQDGLFDAIILSDNHRIRNSSNISELLQIQMLRKKMVQSGLLVFQYWKLSKNVQRQIKCQFFPHFFPMYSYIIQSHEDEGSNIIFGLCHKVEYYKESVVLHQELKKPTNKSMKNIRNKWEQQFFQSLNLIPLSSLQVHQPKLEAGQQDLTYHILKQQKFDDPYQLISAEKCKKKHKKKK